VVSGNKAVALSWDLFATPGPTIRGFRIYRSAGKYNAPSSLICSAGPDVRSYVDTLVAAGASYFYYILSVGDPGENTGSAMTPAGVALTSNRMYTQTVDGAQLVTTGIGPVVSGIPANTVLWQNYPNPFNPSTTISYALPQRSHVTLSIFNTLGQKVATFIDGEVEAGYHTLQFDGSNLASGVYFYRLQAGSFVDTKKFLLMR
jgi:hypothetical protein